MGLSRRNTGINTYQLNVDEKLESKNIYPFSNLLTREKCNEYIDLFNNTVDAYPDGQVNGAVVNKNISFSKDIWALVQEQVEAEMQTKLWLDSGAIRKYKKGTHLVDHYDYVHPGPYFSIILGQQPDDDKIEDYHAYINGVKYIYKLGVGDGLMFPGAKLYHGRPPVFHDEFYVCIFVMRSSEKELL